MKGCQVFVVKLIVDCLFKNTPRVVDSIDLKKCSNLDIPSPTYYTIVTLDFQSFLWAETIILLLYNFLYYYLLFKKSIVGCMKKVRSNKKKTSIWATVWKKRPFWTAMVCGEPISYAGVDFTVTLEVFSPNHSKKPKAPSNVGITITICC